MAESPSAQVDVEQNEPKPVGPPPQYWLRVHGYPSDLGREVVYYSDFGDLLSGRLSGDPVGNLKVGDVMIYYADGPSILYGSGTIVGEVEGPVEDARRGRTRTVPIKRDSIIRAVNKAPHAVGLRPPSGRHFLSLVRDFTYIRLPEEDGLYLLAQIKSRAGSKE